MANKITDPNALSEGLVWVLCRYRDGSEFCFQTTLNVALLNQYGVTLEDGRLVRLDKQYFEYGAMVYRQFSYADATISLWDEEHYTDEESAKLRHFM